MSGRPSGFTPEEEKVQTGEQAKDAFALLPKYNGIPTQVVTTLFPNNLVDWTQGQGANRSARSPMFTYADNLSWTKGVHAFKFGGEFRTAHSVSANDSNMTPITRLGAGGAAVTGIDNTSIPGLTGNNQTLARNLLIDLSGSVASIQQGFDIRDPKDTAFRGYNDDVKFRIRNWNTRDFSLFVKDGSSRRIRLELFRQQSDRREHELRAHRARINWVLGNFRHQTQSPNSAISPALRCNNAPALPGNEKAFFLCPGSGPERTYPRRFNPKKLMDFRRIRQYSFETPSDLKLR